MFSKSLSSSKREKRPQSHQQTSPVPAPPSSTCKRARSSLPKLSPSASCPHLPLLAGKPSPPAVTSTAAFGATTPTTEIFWGVTISKSRSTEEGASTAGATAKSRRLSMSEFPWDARPSSGRMSPAAELTGNIARRSRPATPTRVEGSAGFRDRMDRISPGSNLRLELPASRLDERHPLDPNACSRHRGFVGQPLLGLAYPTTPDIGVHSSPVMCEACKDGAPGHHSGQGGGGLVGGAAAQHLLLAAGPHGRGGIALLTPPDDNGILDWQQNGMERIQADRETAARMIGNMKGVPSAQSGGSAPAERVEVNPSGSDEGAAATLNGGLSSSASSVEDSTTRPEERTVEEEGTASANGEWIENAMEILVGNAFPSCMATEAVRVLSYTLPCPLPDAPGSAVPSSSSNPANPDRLPASAASAPAVAEAAGQQLSPMVLARCTSKDGGIEPLRVSDWGTTTALHHLTAAVQRRFMSEGSRRVYIHVSHAIDPMIPLTRLPSTPPTSHEGDGGYFAPTVFNSIVIAPNSLASTPVPGTPLHAYPPPLPFSNPILPPNSLHLTLLERYIPPATPTEDAAMFSTRSSILTDRLFELSPQGGSLLFIYPTKTGAMNFDRDYLGPVLDPLLRKLMVLYHLREDLLWGVRNMSSMAHMVEFPALQQRLEQFCDALSNGEGELPRLPTKLIYSSKAMVSVNELSWREWWTQQEQIRIREVVKKHGSTTTNSGPTALSEKGKETEGKSGFWQGYGQPGDLAREILDGVRAPTVRPSSRGMSQAVLASSMSGSGGGVGSVAPVGVGRIAGGIQRLETTKNRGVEVGIFILRRGLD